MRSFAAAILALALCTSNGFAADNGSPLAPGKPAGVKEANLESGGVLLWVGLAVVAAGIAIVVSNSGNGPTTSTTATTP